VLLLHPTTVLFFVAFPSSKAQLVPWDMTPYCSLEVQTIQQEKMCVNSDL
jgi:hypothetical protein